MHELVDSVPADELRKWEAVALIDGWGDEDTRTARICEAVHNAVMLAASKFPGASVEEKDFRRIDDFMPKFQFERKKQKTRAQTPEELEAIGKSMAGF